MNYNWLLRTPKKLRRPQEFHGRPRAALMRPYGARTVALRYVAHPTGNARPTHGYRTPAARHPYGPRGSLRHAWSGYIYQFCFHMYSGSVSLAARSPYGPPAAALRAPCGRLAATLRLPWYLSKTYSRRRDALRRPCVITSKAVRQPQVFCLHKFKIRRAATLTYVTATVCDRGNAAAAL